MTLSAIYFLDMKGKVLISRNYRGDIDNTIIDKVNNIVCFLTKRVKSTWWDFLNSIVQLQFINYVSEREEDGSLTPLICTQVRWNFRNICNKKRKSTDIFNPDRNVPMLSSSTTICMWLQQQRKIPTSPWFLFCSIKFAR